MCYIGAQNPGPEKKNPWAEKQPLWTLTAWSQPWQPSKAWGKL